MIKKSFIQTFHFNKRDEKKTQKIAQTKKIRKTKENHENFSFDTNQRKISKK